MCPMIAFTISDLCPHGCVGIANYEKTEKTFVNQELLVKPEVLLPNLVVDLSSSIQVHVG
jgi:hypothetical protein